MEVAEILIEICWRMFLVKQSLCEPVGAKELESYRAKARELES
jgi:hypothetical protein